MATLAESLVSSTSRPLTLRMRPDLVARRQRYHGLTYWVVKEPVSLSYYRFHEEEYAILCMMDGRTSLEEIKNEFETQFTPQKITFQDLLQFVGMLHRSGLVISESAGQGRQLKKRRDEKKWRELMGKLSNVFALRFRGIDPEKLLNWLYKYTWWFFTPQAVFCSFMLGLSALSLVMIQFDVFSARLPAFHEFFGVKNWIFLGVTMAVVKVLHEFGHGLSCKHFGGECHELGAMLLVFTPALYCNVSDSWMLPSKYHRAYIGAAGMYVELILASIATFLWWFSEPGLLNHICLSVMFICSVSTVMFNGNPLMRFDGYYILMDLLEIPNLRQKSTEVVKRAWMHYCLGVEQPENPFLPQRNQFWFGLFTIAAVIYRWMIVFSILYFLNSVFEPVGLKRLGQLIALAGFVGLVVQPLVQLYKFVYTPGRMRKVKRLNVSITIAVAVAAVASIFVVPLPHAVKCSFEVQPRGAKPVYASVPGAVNADGILVRPGDHVKAGQLIAQLENLDVEHEYQVALSTVKDAETELNSLAEQRVVNDNVHLKLEQAQEALVTAKEALAEKEQDRERLRLVAPSDGVIVPPPPRKDQSSKAEGRLAKWSASPFDQKNQNAWFSTSDLVCLVHDPAKGLEASLVIDQADVELVRISDKVRILIDANTHSAFDTTVEAISSTGMVAIPQTMSSQGGGRIDTRSDPASGMQIPLSASYQARAPLPEIARTDWQVGIQGQARIYTGWKTIAWRLGRYLSRTFHFEL
jgi:putative peptide zinc metalloprotease protein